MEIAALVEIQATKEQVWEVLSDIETYGETFTDIKSIEIIEDSKWAPLGIKWIEVRNFLGKEASETMWVTEVAEGESYICEAINSGCHYYTSYIIEQKDQKVIVKKTFEIVPVTLLAKLLSPIMSFMKGTLEKCLAKDLEDLKRFIEIKK